MFYNVSWKKYENPERYSILQEIWKWRAFWYREPLYQNEK
jgi:hypothetical protein